MLIADAPWEITSTFAGGTARKILDASPGVVRSPMPTTETIARRSSVQASPSSESSRTTGSSRERSSTVSETLTSPLASTSTTTSCRSKISNIARRKP